LTQALGEDKSNTLVDRILLAAASSVWISLKWMEPAVADVIRFEHRRFRISSVASLDLNHGGRGDQLFCSQCVLECNLLRVAALIPYSLPQLKETQ